MEVKMPQLGESVTEGTVSAWLKQPGDTVEQYDSLLEVITDKVNAEVPSPQAGTIRELLVQEGETVPVGTPICILDVEGEAPAGTPAAPAAASGGGVSAGPAAGAEIGAAAVSTGTAASAAQAGAEAARSGRYSPAVRRLARERGVDLSGVPGTGAGGRVTRVDVEQYLEAGGPAAVQAARSASGPAPQAAPAAAAPAARPAPAAPAAQAGPDDELVPLTPIRRAIARNMVLSTSTIPHAWTMVEADVTAIDRLLQAQGAAFRRDNGVNLTYLPFVLKAVVAALRKEPQVNATWSDDGIILHRRIHLGLAVAAPDGLVVPVVHDADRLSLAGLAGAVADLAARARNGKLTVDDMQGGTFTVDNTGALGTELSMPIIVPGQTGNLTTERVKRKPVVVGDAIAIRSIMALCLSFDHRVADGAEAARFIKEVRSGIEAFGEDTNLY